MSLSPSAALIDFLEYLKFQKRYSAHTLLSYENDCQSFFDFTQTNYGVLPLNEIAAVYVRTWLASLKEVDMASKSVNRKISTLKSFFKYLLRRELIEVSPMITISALKVNKRLPSFVREKEIDTLFQHVEFPDSWEGRTQQLILQIFYQSGIRSSELINLKVSHVDTGNSNIKVLGKGNKERIIPINNVLAASISAYEAAKSAELKQYDGTYLLLNNKGRKLYPKYVYNVVKQYLGKVTTNTKKSPHILRHSFATHLMNNGAELNAVKELLGHSSLAATQIYTHNTIEKLKDIHKKAHPRGQ